MMGLRVLAILLLVTPILCADFTYDNGPLGPANWASLYPHDCAGTKQSPIDIKSYQATSTNLPHLYIGYFYWNYGTPYGTVTNNGHSVELTFTRNLYISGGGLPGNEYKVAQLHYHFGSTNGQGSEHALNGKHYEAEMHLVTYNTKYASLDEAQKHANGVAVFAGMIKVATSSNQKYTKFLTAVQKITYKGNSSPFSLDCCLVDLLPPDLGYFYRYTGSFTTPHCNEVVIWTVWETPVKLSQSQMAVFRGLFSSAATATKVPLANNYRPLQALNKRPVLFSPQHYYPRLLDHIYADGDGDDDDDL